MAGEFLEQAGLAFHDRLAGERADVAQPEHRRFVCVAAIRGNGAALFYTARCIRYRV